jgi:cellulose synthase operon protein B
MKKILRLCLSITVLSVILFAPVSGFAQDAPPTPEVLPPFPLESGIIPFSALGEPDMLMRGPYHSADVRFTLPSSWKLEQGASLTLLITAAFSSYETIGARSSGASLRVMFNDQIVSTLYIRDEGEQVFNIPIPNSALAVDRPDGRHIIDFFLDAAFDCEYPHSTTIIVRASSTIELPHTLISPIPDLTILPRPFYQQNLFLPEAALLIIPEQPTAGELQAALTVAAAFGRMSTGELSLQLHTPSQLTAEMRANSHLIFVGSTESFALLLQQVPFPESIVQPGDGSLQEAVSPWNQTRMVLHIGGADESGMLKAAQALTFGIIQPGPDLGTAVISDVNPVSAVPLVATSRTFADLGYPSRTLNRFGVSTLEYRFYIPPGYVPGDDPYLNLVFSHSALLDFNESGLVVILNDQRINSARFTEETSQGLNIIKVPLYAEALRAGDNRLVIQVEMRPINICSTFSDQGLWATVSANSLLHIPLFPARPGETNMLINLSQFPSPFISSPTLGDVVFVLAPNNVESWRVAAQLAAQLGRRATGQLLTPQLTFADALSDDFLQNHLIVVGEPAQLPLVSEMADAMPAPFEPGSNMVTERTLTVAYRLPEGTSLGYIELFASPWNIERSVLTLLGSTPEGLTWALQALTDSTLRGRVTGNYVVVNRTQILATDTRIGDTTIVPSGEQALPTTPVVPTDPTPVQATSNWILPAIIVISLLIVGVLVIVVIRSLRQARR